MDASPNMLLPLLIYISFFLLMVVYAFLLILGFNLGVVPRMGVRPIEPAPFGSCLFLCYLFIWSTQ